MSLVSGDDVGGDVTKGMAHVQAGPGRVGKHAEDVVLWPFVVFADAVGIVFGPKGLPFRFYFPEVVVHFPMIKTGDKIIIFAGFRIAGRVWVRRPTARGTDWLFRSPAAEVSAIA